MRIPCLVALTVAAACPLGAQVSDSAARAIAERALKASPVIDGHNDLAWAIRENAAAPGDVAVYDLRHRTPRMTDLDRLRRGMVGGQFWSVYIPGETDDSAYAANGAVTDRPGYARVQLEQIDIARRFIARYPDRLMPAYTAADLRAAIAAGKVGSVLGMEGGHAIDNSLGVLRAYYALGVRYMTLTHNVTLDWADAALDTARHGGLTPFGREVVREMNRLGMLVDLSHVSPGTMSAALAVSEAPVIFSHSGARALVDHRRNVPDSILRKVPANGGIVMVPFVTSFVSPAVYAHDTAESHVAAPDLAAWRVAHPTPKATLTQVADVVDHVRQIVGVDHVGIGGDFDGITDTVVGLEDVSTYPALFTELARRGWTEADLLKLAGENVLRVLAQAEVVAARLQRERPPSTATIQQLDGVGIKQ